MKRSGDSTHPCRSSTPIMNGRNLILLTRTQTFEQECNDLMDRNRRPSTPYSRNTPKAFHEEPAVCFLEVGRAYVGVICIVPRFQNTLLESENLVCSATAGMQTALGIIQLWFNCFAASFFKALVAINVNFFKIPQQHHGPHKTPSQAACLRPMI